MKKYVLVTTTILNISLVFGITCPTDIDELNELLSTGKWLTDVPHYSIKICPWYYPESEKEDSSFSHYTPVQVKSLMTVRVNLTSVEKKFKLACIFQLEPYEVFRKDGWSKWENNNHTGLLAGTLYYKNADYYSTMYDIQNMLFALPTGSISLLKAHYQLSVARPTKLDTPTASNTPLEKSERMQNNPEWTWDIFHETIPLLPDQVLVQIFGNGWRETLHKKDFKTLSHNRTVTLYWGVPNTAGYVSTENDTAHWLAEWHTKLIDHFEKRFQESRLIDDLGIYYVRDMHSQYAPGPEGSDSFFNATLKYYGFVFGSTLGKFRSARWGRSNLCYMDKSSEASMFEPFIVGILNQWLGFIRLSPEPHSELLLRGLFTNLYEEALIVLQEESETFSWELDFVKRKEHLAFKTLEAVVSPLVFKHGLIDNFLAKLRTSEAVLTTEDMLASLQHSVVAHNQTNVLPNGLLVKNLMDNWLTYSEKVLVRVSFSEEDPTVLHFAREIDHYDNISMHIEAKEVEHVGVWIPLKIYANKKIHLVWLSPSDMHSTLKLASALDSSEYFWVNPDIPSFRILYDQSLTDALTRQWAKNRNIIPSFTRGNLIRDYMLFARQNLTQIENVLTWLNFLETEDDFTVWRSVINGILLDKVNLNIQGLVKHKLYKHIGLIRDKAFEKQEAGLLHEQLLLGCLSTTTGACVNYAKQRLNDEIDENKFHRCFDNNNAFHCLALQGELPGSKLFNATANRYSEEWTILCTGDQDSMFQRLRKDLTFRKHSFMCIPCFGCHDSRSQHLNEGRIAQEHFDMIHPIYLQLRNYILKEEKMNAWDFGEFLLNFGVHNPAVMEDLDQFLLEYKETCPANAESNDNITCSTLSGDWWDFHAHSVQSSPSCLNHMQPDLPPPGLDFPEQSTPSPLSIETKNALYVKALEKYVTKAKEKRNDIWKESGTFSEHLLKLLDA